MSAHFKAEVSLVFLEEDEITSEDVENYKSTIANKDFTKQEAALILGLREEAVE
jgi:hypothetical protein